MLHMLKTSLSQGWFFYWINFETAAKFRCANFEALLLYLIFAAS